MYKLIKKIFFIVLFFCLTISVKAGNLGISANKSVVEGNTIKVSVSISNLAGRFKVTSSDQSILAGSAEDWYEDSFTVTFNAKKPGTATVTVTAIDAADSDTETAFTGSRSVTINVTQKTTKQEIDINKKYSSDNYLKELSVEGTELSPEFNKDTLEYNVDLDYNVEKINIIGKANDTKANVKGLGEFNVNEGSNNFEIVVVAENGNERVYKIIANVEDQNPIKVTVNKKEYLVVKKILPEQIPNNYVETKITINDIETIGYYNAVTSYTLVPLKDEDGNISFYIYDSKKETFKKYRELDFSNDIILFEQKPENIPEGYKKVDLKINDEEVSAYQNDTDSNYYLLYGMNIENGSSDWYRFDIEEKTIQKYDSHEYDELIKDKNKFYTTTVVMSSISILLLLSIIILLFKLRNSKK
ncbi:MAG: cadherin-like beta sandwich domain-containing protein [Bacilli bacterium]|nr:cadherin-like beta sandwich domain-containing protein [Bacilli bacterium]